MSDNPKSAITIVADYIFSSDHEDSDVSWLFRKLDRHQNDNSWTLDACPSPCPSNDTLMLKLRLESSSAEIGDGLVSKSDSNLKKRVVVERTPGDHVKTRRLFFFEKLDARNCKNFAHIDI